MTPEFTTAVVPLMLDVVALAERASSGHAGPVEAERAVLRARFDTATALCRGPMAHDWELASYALAAVADELMIVDIPWPGQSWWENHALEVELFGTRKRATEFYASAERAAALPNGDAMQVFLAAVVMGFRGNLRDRPEALDTWLRSHGRAVKLASDRPAVPESGPDVPGAPPLGSRQTLLWSMLIMAIAAAAVIVESWWAFFL